jgi:RNA polymerase sigma-70 factor (ECF subfamily)
MLKPDIRSLRAGDRFMWDCAFHWLWPIAWSAAQRRLAACAPADIEDVAVGAIREAAEKVQAGKVESFEELRALTSVISGRRALDHIRRMQAERRASGATESIEGREELPSAAPGPLERVNAQDLARLLMSLTAKLPNHQQRLLKAYYLYGLKQAELAETFGVPIGTVGVTLSRALESLRAELQKQPQLMKEFLEALR